MSLQPMMWGKDKDKHSRRSETNPRHGALPLVSAVSPGSRWWSDKDRGRQGPSSLHRRRKGCGAFRRPGSQSLLPTPSQGPELRFTYR